MSDRPEYPSYPGDDDATRPASPPQQEPPSGYGQVPPPGYGQAPPPPGYGYAPPPGYGYAPPPPGYGYAPPPAVSGTKSVVSLVLGIVSIVFCYLGLLIGPAAIIVAVLARKEIGAAQNAGHPHGPVPGTGMATAGLVTGIVGTVIWAGVVALVIVDLSTR